MPYNYIIKQIQVGWKGQSDILWSLSKRFSPLEDRKSATFFKINDVFSKLDGPPIITKYTLISIDYLDFEASKIKYKWAREFENLLYFSEENIETWKFSYLNLNNNILTIVTESRETIIEIEKVMFEKNIKKDIIVHPLLDYITEWLEKSLVAVGGANQLWQLFLVITNQEAVSYLQQWYEKCIRSQQ